MKFNIYFSKFRNCIYTMLGGWDMAKEFSSLHPDFNRAMRNEAQYHFRKGGRYTKGAAIWFKQVVLPAIRRDRERAMKIPL